jgi:hypothetical protein
MAGKRGGRTLAFGMAVAGLAMVAVPGLARSWGRNQHLEPKAVEHRLQRGMSLFGAEFTSPGATPGPG